MKKGIGSLWYPELGLRFILYALNQVWGDRKVAVDAAQSITYHCRIVACSMANEYSDGEITPA